MLIDADAELTSAPAIDPARVRALAERVVASPRAARVTTSAPFTGGPLAELPQSTAQDVQFAVDGARAVQRSWRHRDVRDRARVLLRLHDLVLEHQSELLDLVQLETGKARLHAFEEVFDVALVARHYARRGPSYLAAHRRPGFVPGVVSVREQRHPQGVVGIIAPWNYPLTLALTDALPALLAGNAVVLKPDTQTALTALRCAQLLAEAGLPEGLLQVVLGEGDMVGAAVVETCDYLCFTGSTRIGRVVAEAAGRRLVGCSLELGGKNALYVASDAALDRAAEAAVRACFASAGQLCISMERLVLHEEIADAFLDRFLGRVRALRLGSGLDFGSDLGSLVSQRQLEMVTGHVQDAVRHGATVLAGGRARPDIGPFFHEPTVLEGVTPQMDCHSQETFGPLVSVYRVTSDDEAVALANTGDYGLNASVWSRDLGRGRRVAAQLVAGTVNVNEGYLASWASTAAPMGGMRASGLGRRHGSEGITKYTQVQSVATTRGPWFGMLYGLDGERAASALTAGLRVARRVGLG